jgi:hypothetical protein
MASSAAGGRDGSPASAGGGESSAGAIVDGVFVMCSNSNRWFWSYFIAFEDCEVEENMTEHLCKSRMNEK